MCDLVAEINKADALEIEVLLKAVLQRYAVLFPDWEWSVFSLQKSADRNRQIDAAVALLQKMKSSP